MPAPHAARICRSAALAALALTPIAWPSAANALPAADRSHQALAADSLWSASATRDVSSYATTSTRGDTLASRLEHDVVPLVESPAHWKARQLRLLGAGVAAVGVARLFDTRIRDAVMRSPAEDPHRYDWIRTFGQEGGLAALGATWAVGAAADRPEAEAIACDGFEAVILAAGAITPVLKFSIGRARPYQEEGPSSFHPFGGDLSFPSGEATEAFAIASVISAHQAPLWVKGGAWTLAGAVGWARVHADAHWASDVVAGAIIGTSVGEWVVHRRRPAADDTRQTELLPLLAPHGGGVELLLRF